MLHTHTHAHTCTHSYSHIYTYAYIHTALTKTPGIQLFITASNFPDDCKYLNLRLRMEQQRLFAWSETSGLMDLDASNDTTKVLASNTFILHRTTVLDLLVQVQCLFDEFRRHAEHNQLLDPLLASATSSSTSTSTTTTDDSAAEKDAAAALFPLPPRRRDFLRKAMRSLRGGATRLRWASFDKAAFELLLTRFAALNDSMTDILDASMQVEIHHAVQDTNRGVLLLHHRVEDLSRLVQALGVRLEMSSAVGNGLGGKAVGRTPLAEARERRNEEGRVLLAQLARFKAFNTSVEGDGRPWDPAAAVRLGLGKKSSGRPLLRSCPSSNNDPFLENPSQQKNLQLDRSMIILDPETSDAPRCEALLRIPGQADKRCWVEWKDYDAQGPGDATPPKEEIFTRVRKLATLLNHRPKPDAFRTPHCLGYFDKAQDYQPSEDDEEEEGDILNHRLGLVFSRPADVHASLPPISLHALLLTACKPRVTDRVALAHAVAHCLLHLHSVNWLHKGLRSHNILFFPPPPLADDNNPDDDKKKHAIAYDKPYLSGFDFSRPARPDEMTQVPPDDIALDIYRHPLAQSAAARGGENKNNKRTRFRRSFDVFGLGVMFVEIALWRTVDSVLGIDLVGGAAGGGGGHRSSRRAALGVREGLLGAAVMEQVGASMGLRFEEAARTCLAGGEALGLGGGGGRGRMRWGMRRLRGCRCGFMRMLCRVWGIYVCD